MGLVRLAEQRAAGRSCGQQYVLRRILRKRWTGNNRDICKGRCGAKQCQPCGGEGKKFHAWLGPGATSSLTAAILVEHCSFPKRYLGSAPSALPGERAGPRLQGARPSTKRGPLVGPRKAELA